MTARGNNWSLELDEANPGNAPEAVGAHREGMGRARNHDKPFDEDEETKMFENAYGCMPLTRFFMHTTTIHGLPRVFEKGHHWFRTALWAALFCASFGMFVYVAQFRFDEFYAYNTSTSVDISFQPRVQFPTVTICNSNMYRRSALSYDVLEALWDDEGLTNQEIVEFVAVTINELNSDSSLPTLTREQLFAIAVDELGKEGEDDQELITDDLIELLADRYHFDDDDFYDLLLEKYLRSNRNGGTDAQVLASLFSDEQIGEIGHQLDDLVAFGYAKFKGESIDIATEFERTISHPYGNCYSWNSNGNYVTTRPGPDLAFDLIINLEQQEYLSSSLSGTGKGIDDVSIIPAGLRVHIHDKSEPPFPDAGLTVAPGTQAFISLQQQTITKMTPPHGECVERTDTAAYSVESCFKGCFEKAVFTQCGCRYPAAHAVSRTVGTCSTSDFTDCVDDIEDAFSTDVASFSCGCDDPCNRITYRKNLSHGRWPSVAVSGIISDAYNISTREVGDSFLRVTIYYEELNVIAMTQEEKYSMSALGAELGGLLGLFLGVSVMTVFEFCEYMTFFFRPRMYRKKSVKVTPQS